jgi:hypothetical protein
MKTKTIVYATTYTMAILAGARMATINMKKEPGMMVHAINCSRKISSSRPGWVGYIKSPCLKNKCDA